MLMGSISHASANDKDFWIFFDILGDTTIITSSQSCCDGFTNKYLPKFVSDIKQI